MAKDYKKEYKDLYLPKTKPMIVDIPEMQFVAVEGKGDPNDKNGEYFKAVGILYSIQFTIKMSKMGNNKLNGYFDYVVPPLEGLWWLDNNEKISPKNKSKYNWISMIRLPEFVDKSIFKWACDEVSKKKNIETKNAKFLKIKEGLCVQCMHIGSYDDEPKTIKLIDEFIEENSLKNDISEKRRHHEIYLSDPRKTEIAKVRTVLRIPVKRK
ncbi:MAG: GyrI-like domain-containing protein [Treponema sp.]|nr:GyrI-like domain-containing protein [Treponema sp.]